MSRERPHEARPILVLGANGQVGRELVRCLAPLAAVRGCTREELDIADADAVRRVLDELRPAAIVNAAAYTAVDQAEEAAAVAAAVNAQAPGILAEQAARVGACFVHYSTDYVFDGRARQPYRETDPAAPLGVYGQTKLAGERAVLAAGGAAVVLRCSWVYGLHGRNFLRTVQRLARERPVLRIVDDQIGSPTWSRSIAAATTLLLAGVGLSAERLRERAGLYHLASAGQTSWHGFAAAIVEAMPQAGAVTVEAIPTTAYPTPAPRPAYSVLDCSRLQASFGLCLPDWRAQLALVLADQTGSV